LGELYSDILLDHYRLPRNRGILSDETLSVEGVNPLCGDELKLHLRFDSDRLSDISFEGKGCAISLASASMLTETLKGKSLADVEAWIAAFRDFMRTGQTPAGWDMGDIESLGGVSKLPVRVKCATLAWTTLQEGLSRYKGS
jgi:nitrogen fixation NifU-like protein